MTAKEFLVVTAVIAAFLFLYLALRYPFAIGRKVRDRKTAAIQSAIHDHEHAGWLRIPELSTMGMMVKPLSDIAVCTPKDTFAFYVLPRVSRFLWAAVVGLAVTAAVRGIAPTGLGNLSGMATVWAVWLPSTLVVFLVLVYSLPKKGIPPTLIDPSFLSGKPLQWDAESAMNGMRLQARFNNVDHADQLAFDRGAPEFEKTLHWNAMVGKADKVFHHGQGIVVIEYKTLAESPEPVTRINWESKVKRRHVLQALAHALIISRLTGKFTVTMLIYRKDATICITPTVDHLIALSTLATRFAEKHPGASISASELAALADPLWDDAFKAASLAGRAAHATFSKEPVVVI